MCSLGRVYRQFTAIHSLLHQGTLEVSSETSRQQYQITRRHNLERAITRPIVMTVKKFKFHSGMTMEGKREGVSGTNNNSKYFICGKEIPIILGLEL